MHFIYLDESGDPGLTNSPTTHYILAGLSVHHGDWKTVNDRLMSFRMESEKSLGYPFHRELHASELLGAANSFRGVNRTNRLLLARNLVHLLARSREIRAFAWIVKKSDHNPVPQVSARCLSDLSNWSQTGKLNGGSTCGMNGVFIVHDFTSSPLFGEHSNHPILMGMPAGQDSEASHLLQAADLIAYLIKQKYSPNRHLLKSGGVNLCDKLDSVSLGWHELS